MDRSLTSKVLTLPAQDGDDLRFETLLSAQQTACRPDQGYCRVVELISQSGHPFEAQLSWTAGGGANLTAKLTVARATRVAVLARTLEIRAANLAEKTNRISGTVVDTDSVLQTRNIWEFKGFHLKGASSQVALPIPPFSQRLSFYPTQFSQTSAWFLLVYDGQGQLRSGTPLASIPTDGIPLGDAGKVEVLSLGAPSAWRAIFHLSL